VILNRDIEHPSGLHQLLSGDAIVGRRRWIATRMIVNQDYRCRILCDRLAENLTRVNQ
jgi:hypothetical protein